MALHDYSQHLLNNQICKYHSFSELPSVNPSQWALQSSESFYFLDTNFCSWHSPRLELSQLREPKRIFEEKLSRLPRLPYPPRTDNSSPETGSRSWLFTFGWNFSQNKYRVLSKGFSCNFWRYHPLRVDSGVGMHFQLKSHLRSVSKRQDFMVSYISSTTYTKLKVVFAIAWKC